MMWKGRVYIDNTLPFGLRSAPKLFSAVADAFLWVLRQRGIQYIFHYVDDFIAIAQMREECTEAMERIESTAHELGIPIEPSKTEGPAATLTFLGIEIDTQNLELRLPRNKIQELKELLLLWLGKKLGT